MFQRIENAGGAISARMILALLSGVFAISVALQVSNFNAAIGSGSGGSSRDGVPYVIHGTIRTPLQPGAAAVPIDVTFNSANAGNGGGGDPGVHVSRLTALITSVTGQTGNGRGACSVADFELKQFTGAYPFIIPFGASSLSSLGFSERDWPTLRLKNTGSNQDRCSGAAVTLAYRGTP